MGALFSKVAPLRLKDDGAVDTTMLDYESSPKKFLDPRSPNPFRTPISNLPLNAAKPVIRAQNLTTDESISTSTVVTPTKLKTKLLRDLGYTLDSIDPRSPAQNFNRTPIAFDDSIISDDFSLAGLSLNESNLQTPIKENQQESFCTPVEEDGKFAASKIDPRSPSIEIERTPLILNNLLADAQKDEVGKFTASKTDPRSPSIHIERTPLILNDLLTDAQIDEDPQSDVDKVVETPFEEETTFAVIRSMIYMDENKQQTTTPNVKCGNVEKIEKVRTPLSSHWLMNSQSDSRNDKRLKIHNKPMLARTIFKDAAAHHNTNKTNNSSSKIPVMRKSLSKEN